MGAGWTQNEEVIVKIFEHVDDAIYAACSITYDQLRYGGCEETPHSDACYETFKIAVYLESGDVTFETDEDIYAD